MKNIIDYSSGIELYSINRCSDKEQLLQWKSELLSDLTDIKSVLENYEFEYDPTIGHSDFTWYSKASLAKRIKGRLMFAIDTRIGQVNREHKSKEKSI